MNKELQKRILSSIIIVPFSFFFIIKGSTLFILFLITLFFISSSEWLNLVKKLKLKILGLLFLTFSFYSTFYYREVNLEFFLLIVIACISTDLGGYIFGKVFKGPKLIKISPNKTYSGMLGSFLLSIIFSYLYVIQYIPGLDNLQFFIIIITISSTSQIGDLIISFFKRSSKIKNTGKIFPGHGGLLDRIDGMIFVFPVLFLFNIIFS